MVGGRDARVLEPSPPCVLEPPWFADDLTAAMAAAPDAILIPKISKAEQLEWIAQRMLSTHAAHRTRIWAMIETPAAIFNVREIAAAAKDAETRLSGFVLGLNDLASAAKLARRRNGHCFANAMRHEPRGLVGHA